MKPASTAARWFLASRLSCGLAMGEEIRRAERAEGDVDERSQHRGIERAQEDLDRERGDPRPEVAVGGEQEPRRERDRGGEEEDDELRRWPLAMQAVAHRAHAEADGREDARGQAEEPPRLRVGHEADDEA